MNDEPRTLRTLPIACNLPVSQGRAQLERWREFDNEYALAAEETPTRYLVHYAKVPDSETRLTELIAQESTCCSFVDWSIDTTGHDLLLVVTGTPDALAALSIR